MLKKIGLLKLAIVALFLITIVVPFSFAAETFKIGLITWTEDVQLETGRAHTRGFNTAIAKINAEGGVLGQKVEGIVTSQGPTGETAKAACLRLVQKEKVKFFVGPMWGSAADAGLAISKRYHMPYQPEQGGMWVYEQGYPALNAVACGNARSRTMPQMDFIEKNGFKKVVMLWADISYNHDCDKMIKDRWGKPDSPVKVIDNIWYQIGKKDLTQELTKAVAQKPDFIWSQEHSEVVAVGLMKTLHELGYKGAYSVCQFITNDGLAQIPKEYSEGAYAYMDYAPDLNIPANKEFIDFYQSIHGTKELPYGQEENVFQLTYLALRAVKIAGVPPGTKENLMKISNAMHSMKWMSPRGEVARLSKEGVGLWHYEPMTQVQNGKVVVIDYIKMKPNWWLPWLPETWDELDQKYMKK
jgi:ABC-type branched-subunit amino acid transport system substrate-binding protein